MTLKCIRDFLVVGLVLVLSLGMIACKTTTLISNLELVVNAATVAIPIIFAATKVDAVTQANVIAYLNAVDNAVIQSGTELQSTDIQAVKASKIVSYFAGAVMPNLPAGIPQAVAAAINAVAQEVAKFLSQLQPVAGVARSGTQGNVKVDAKAVPTSLNSNDKAALSVVMAKANDNLLALKAGAAKKR